jgi:iron-sulfur cluster insertion protein
MAKGRRIVRILAQLPFCVFLRYNALMDFYITEAAAQRIATLAESSAKSSSMPVAGLRVAVDGGGCSGFKYNFTLEEQAPLVGDCVLPLDNGFKVYIDDVSQPFLIGSTLDFIDDLMGQSFRVENPQATASCGCGVSFTL